MAQLHYSHLWDGVTFAAQSNQRVRFYILLILISIKRLLEFTVNISYRESNCTIQRLTECAITEYTRDYVQFVFKHYRGHLVSETILYITLAIFLDLLDHIK